MHIAAVKRNFCNFREIRPRRDDRGTGKFESAEADRISQPFQPRYDNRARNLLHHLTVHPGLQEQRAGRENPIGEFLGVTGPRNGVADAAAATSIPRGSDRDGSGVRGGVAAGGDGGGVTRCEKGL
ncbi:hypothetical protein KM043_007052 [Ampulex compressa]|nr:hypothetical protein KM043_007052 [Ampulex compressa]